MTHELLPDILESPLFSIIFFPREDPYPEDVPEGARNILIDVDGERIGARFYLKDKSLPTILYFHGNGEIARDYDDIFHLFWERGANLFVSDYRGYGLSTGRPTLKNIITDSHKVFERFKKVLEENSCSGGIFIMGRSLGSMPAIELAYHYGDEINGLIIESGSAENFPRIARYCGVRLEPELEERLRSLSNVEKIKRVKTPLLVIHGEFDSIIPLEEGIKLYENSPAEKTLVVIPRADHNNLLWLGMDIYFSALEEFLSYNRRRRCYEGES